MQTTVTFEIGIQLTSLTCATRGCDIVFAIPTTYMKARQRDHAAFYCPNGHVNFYPQESDLEKLQKQLATANGNAKYHAERAESLERSRRALRGVATRYRNKAIVGECAFCHRHFSDLAFHVQTEHPEQNPDAPIVETADEATADA